MPVCPGKSENEWQSMSGVLASSTVVHPNFKMIGTYVNSDDPSTPSYPPKRAPPLNKQMVILPGPLLGMHLHIIWVSLTISLCLWYDPPYVKTVGNGRRITLLNP